MKQKATLSPTKEPRVDYRHGETPTGKSQSVGNPLGECTHSSGMGAPCVPIRGHKKHPAAR